MFIKTVICSRYSNSFEAKQQNKLAINKAKFIAINKSNNAFITTNSLKVAQKYNKNAVYAVYEINYSYMITYRINENTPLFFGSLQEVETRYFSFKCIITKDNNEYRSIKLDKAIEAFKDSDIIKNASKISFKVETEKSWVYSIDNTSTCIFINKNTLESYISTFKQRYTIKDLLKKYNCNKSELKSNLKYMLMKKIIDYDNYTATNIFVRYLKLMLGYSKKRILDIFKNNPQCISTVKNILDSISIEKKEYITNKENYHNTIKENRKHIENTIEANFLNTIDGIFNDNYNTALNNAKKVLTFKRYSEIRKQNINNSNLYSFKTIAKLSLLNINYLITTLNNKDIELNSYKLRELQQQLYKAKNYCKNIQLKDLLTFYENCYYSLFLIVDDIEASESIKELENTLFNSENLKQEYCLNCDC